MERPLELVILVALTAIVGVFVLRHGQRSKLRQAATGVIVGLVSAGIAVSGQADLVPDGLEPVAAVITVGVLIGVAAVTLLRRPASR